MLGVVVLNTAYMCVAEYSLDISMGNHHHRPKLQRKFSSLPAQDFPTMTPTGSFSRKSTQSSTSRRRKRELSFMQQQRQREGHGWPVAFVNTLFLPEYPPKETVAPADLMELEVIANGSFGQVLKVERPDTSAVFAMKVMKKSRVITEGAVQQCKEEAAIQRQIGNHPLIVSLYCCFQHKENLHIVMEYISGGELFSEWKLQPQFSEQKVQLYVAQLALVLDYLHEAGVIYRDLKMENILINSRGHLQVTDFGLAKHLKRGERTRTICGTLQYIAPEILNMMPYGHSSDWWSLGILMFSLLAGQYPIAAAGNHFEMAKLVAAQTYDLPYHVPYSYEARHACKQLLRHDPRDRVCNLSDLESLPFFCHLNFDLLLDQLVSGIYVPIQETKTIPNQSHQQLQNQHINNQQQDEFQDFVCDNYNAPGNRDDVRWRHQAKSTPQHLAPGCHHINTSAMNMGGSSAAHYHNHHQHDQSYIEPSSRSLNASLNNTRDSPMQFGKTTYHYAWDESVASIEGVYV